MAQVMRDLWPELPAAILSPVAILRYQAEKLVTKTNGLLAAEVISHKAKSTMRHEFRISADAIDYSINLFRATHGIDLVYPVAIDFDPWVHELGPHDGIEHLNTPDELLASLARLLSSDFTRSLLVSLIARINDSKPRSTSPKK